MRLAVLNELSNHWRVLSSRREDKSSVTLDIDLEQFFHGFAVVMEGANGQRFSFTQRRAFPFAAYLFEGQASGLNQGIHQPDVAVECRAYHKRFD